jgi:ADP-ribosylglycohydrolase
MSIDRIKLAEQSLLGVSIGDAFGDSFFGDESYIKIAIENKKIPKTLWQFTDDTVMAISLFKSLEKYGNINQDYIANSFTENYFKDINRGYGPSMHRYFREQKEGGYWKDISCSKFQGMGSMGNGGAMRASIVGAFFYDDLEKVKEQTRLSCEITHANIEAIEGAKVVAVATALTTQMRLKKIEFSTQNFLKRIYLEMEDCDIKSKINKAISLEGSFRIETIVHALGNGIKMTAQDTVPLALWCASRNLSNYENCLWQTVSALGDRDTTCAIAGGITIMSSNFENIPQEWVSKVENWKESIFNQN